MAQQEQLQQHHHQEQQQQREQQQQLQFQQELTHYNKNLCNLNYIMEDPERRKRREREKYERQQGIQSDDRETSLFGEPRRLTPGEADAEITAALGEFIDARDYMNNSTVGIYRQAPCASNTRLQVLSKSSVVGVNSSTTSSPILSSSASSSASVPGQLPTLQQQQQQPQQHYQQQQRVPTYLKQADNKPPYNGRGGYPGQPMKNDIPSSSGMAPPRGPPRSSSSSSSITNNNSSSATNNAAASATSALPSSLPLGPPVSTQMPNGREKSYLGPPAPALSNGGRFVPPPASAKRPSTLGGSGLQPPPPEKDISKMISEMTNNYRVTPLTSIAATPHAPMRENYNLNGPNKFKYAFDAVDPIGPLNSPPATSSVSTLMTPLLAPIAPITSPIAPLLRTPPQASHLPLVAPSLVSKPLQPSLSMSYAVPPTHHLLPTSPNTSPTAPAIKPLKTEKNYTLEKQDSCLENDLELSESDDERKKESRSAENSSNSSESDSSESGSEASSKGDLQQQKTLQHHQEQQQLLLNQQQSHHQQHRQFTGTVNGNKKKYSQTIIASGPNTISGLLTSSGLGGSSAVNSAGNTISGSGGGGGGGSSSSGMGTMSSSSSSNKTPSPTDSNRWTLSRFFPKPANQAAMDSVSPGGANTMGNVSMKVPGILPGGAQIIPESIEVTTAIVKNENLADATRILEIGHNEGNEEQQQQQRYGVGISVTVKKETVEQEQQLDALTNNQIKRESRLSDSGSTGSESNSDSISGSTSSDSVGGSSEVMPLPGPGETLQLPGVPAAITTVIRVPQTPQHRAPKNSVTLTPIGPLPASPKPRQKRSRKKKVSVAHSPTLDSSDEDEPMSSTKKQALELSVIAAAEADTDAENTLIVATALPAIRKGRGRPRKQAQPQLQQSGNLSSASASSSQAKGPTLTAAKKPLAKSTCSPPVIAVAAASRKREHSSNSSSNGNTPTKKSNAVTLSAGTVAALTLLPPSVSAVESSEDESSCSSCSTKSSSSSGSDTEAPAPMTTVSPSTEAAISVVSAAHNPAKKRIVKINKLCSSHKTKQRYTAASSSNSSSSETEEQQQQKQQLLLIQQQHLLQPQSFVLLHPQQEQHNSQRLSSSDCSSSASSGSSSNSSSGSSSDEDETHLGSGKRKSDKKKICTLTRIFNPKEGGAKKQGQVVIIDQSEEQQQHQEQQQLSKTRATPIQGLGFNLASPARTTTPHLTSLMCKISLTKLARVLPEWYKNSCRLSTTEIHQQEQTQQQQHQQERKSQSNGHLSSRSTDEGRTTKDQQSHVSNGYVGGREGNLLVSSVKFEHGVKPEPELDAGSEAKFKQTNNKNSVKQEFMLKQELPAAGRRRKRSSSSSSSPYKEKKRKKEKTDQQSKDLLSVSVMLPANNHERLSRDKLELLHQETSIVISSPKKVQQPIEQPQEMQSQQVHLTAATLGEAATVASVQTAVQPTQLPTTCTEAVQTTSPLVEFPPGPRLIYRSHFDNEDEPVSNDPMKNELLLQEAIKRKRAADSERDSFMQMTLYLEAIVYFLLTADAMERSNSEATWTLYKDTLSLIKYISSKNRPYQQATNGRHESHNIVGILSLRCQSLISLKLYKLRRANCRVTIASCSEFFRSGRGDILNSNTPSSISPSNSVCSQGSGSNTPPGKIVPQDIHNQLCKQNEYLTYVNSAHELWDQADRLVRSGNHIDFIRKLDHENGPLTLHSTMHEVFRYVQAGLKTLRNAVSYPQSQ